MITRLDIRGFKRFKHEGVDLRALTVLSGLNGAGKTTVLQSLLLARQAAASSAPTIALNGPFGLELGSVQDVLNVSAEEDQIVITLKRDDGPDCAFVFEAEDEALLHLPISSKPEIAPSVLAGPSRGFTYLAAERLGPRNVLGASPEPAEDLGVGPRGEFCAQLLAIHELKHKVSEQRRHPARPDDVDAFLKYQVEAWISDMVRPLELQPAMFPGTTVTALRFREPGGEWVSAPNMGFGVSFCLPIVLAGLFAPDGALILVENPEAHLHPAGQSRMGAFLATVAASGVQVVVETHSDHVLNGIRRTIGEDKRLAAANAIVQFFDETAEGVPQGTALEFTDTGSLSDWPERFFDQYQIDVAALARARRPQSP